MKNFRDFYLRGGNRESLLKFCSIISTYITGDWRQVNESRFKEDFIVFAYYGDKINKASVFLYTKDIDKLQFSITNIVPMEKNSLNYDEYNEVLEKCVNECIVPCANECGLSYELTSENVELEKYMSNESAKKLRMFSGAANKSTGSSHPCDGDRWNDFICKTFMDGHENVSTILGRWLTEEDGWDDKHASDLVMEFEQGISLLLHYRKHYNE